MQALLPNLIAPQAGQSALSEQHVSNKQGFKRSREAAVDSAARSLTQRIRMGQLAFRGCSRAFDVAKHAFSAQPQQQRSKQYVETVRSLLAVRAVRTRGVQHAQRSNLLQLHDRHRCAARLDHSRLTRLRAPAALIGACGCGGATVLRKSWSGGSAAVQGGSGPRRA